MLIHVKNENVSQKASLESRNNKKLDNFIKGSRDSVPQL